MSGAVGAHTDSLNRFPLVVMVAMVAIVAVGRSAAIDDDDDDDVMMMMVVVVVVVTAGGQHACGLCFVTTVKILNNVRTKLLPSLCTAWP
jgi:hypothetical protein